MTLDERLALKPGARVLVVDDLGGIHRRTLTEAPHYRGFGIWLCRVSNCLLPLNVNKIAGTWSDAHLDLAEEARVRAGGGH